jgi:hypothetical protein
MKTVVLVVWIMLAVYWVLDYFREELWAAFDRYMTRIGRKTVLVDALGNKVIERYALLWKEDLDLATRKLKIGSPPQLYLHHFVWEFGESPDGPSAHTHLGTTISFMLTGLYREWTPRGILVRRALSFNVVKWPSAHKIVWVRPGTRTLFLRLRTQADDVDVIPEVCDSICNYCEKNHGHCYNEGQRYKYAEYKHQFDSGNKNGIKFPEWHTAGAKLDAWIERRRAAVARLGLQTPVGTQEQLEFSRRTSKLPIMMKDESHACRK